MRQQHTGARPGAARQHSLALQHATRSKDRAWAGVRHCLSRRCSRREAPAVAGAMRRLLKQPKIGSPTSTRKRNVKSKSN
ncbi:hypothetical protein HAX54_017140 [Datura stramonium]|uniref:Uncharacterized protein n=1 Tax=Datura stramonium TaxID=4076 RepID=A0ABS8Y6M9_DATST|nr:hypothetical protein [Datura stramonium]